MKIVHKKIIGAIGLIAVLLMTAFAARIPMPNAAAADTTSITDTIVIRVIDEELSTVITDPESGTQYIEPIVNVKLSYANVGEGDPIIIKVIDPNGNEYEVTQYFPPVTDENTRTSTGYYELTLNLENIVGTKLYGQYTISASTNSIGSYSEDAITINYRPLTVDVLGEQCSNAQGYCDDDVDEDADGTKVIKGNVVVGVNNNDDVTDFDIEVYDQDGNLVLGPTSYDAGDGSNTVALPFDDNDLPEGVYEIRVKGYDENGNLIYTTLTFVHFIPTPDVPKTGSLLEKMNISKRDYMITGLIVFFATVIIALFMIRKRHNKSKR